MLTTYKIVHDQKKLIELIGTIRCNSSNRVKIIFTNGCFDIFHAGHIQYLEHAKSSGDILIVGVNSDESVKRLKGDKRPIIKQEQRLRMIAALQCVDYVILFDEDTPYNLIMLIKPDVLVKGDDWNIKNIVGVDIVRSHGGEVVQVNHEIEISSTKIIQTIAKRYTV